MFFVITSKHISYYYHLDEYISDKVPLATFELKDIYELKQLNDSHYGNKKNIFSVSVSRWIKKEQIKGKRSYIFSCKTLEDLYSWIISINFLRVNAYYNIFTSHFGKIGLPLYKFNKRKPKKFFFNLDDKQIMYNNDKKSALSTKENFTNSQRKKVNISFEKSPSLPELQKKVANIVSNVFLFILGDIQYRLAKFNNDIETDENEIKEIAVPPHLKSCETYRNSDNEDDNKSDEEEEEEEEKEEKEEKKEEENEEEIDKKSKKEETYSIDKSEKEINNEEKIILGKNNNNINEGDEKFRIKKSLNTDVTDEPKIKNNIKKDDDDNNNNNEGENNDNLDYFDDIDDMDFNMNEEEVDTHYPKFFVKDKNIVQLNEYPESINDFENRALVMDSQNAFD